MIARVQVRDVLQDLLKQKAQMLTEGIVASRNGRQVLPVKTPTAIKLQVLFMIFLPAETPSISNPVRWSN